MFWNINHIKPTICAFVINVFYCRKLSTSTTTFSVGDFVIVFMPFINIIIIIINYLVFL